MIDIYFWSLAILFIATFLILPFLAVKGLKIITIIAYYILLFCIALVRPYQEGIDNSNVISVLSVDLFSSSYIYPDDFYKYGFLSLLGYLIPGTWHKLFFLNTLFSLFLIFTQYNFLSRVYKFLSQINGSYTFLLLAYNSLIIPPLILIHFKQFIAFVLINILCFRFPDPREFARKNLILSFFFAIFILIVHPAYIGFVLFYYLYCHIDTFIFYFYRFNISSRLLILAFLSIFSLYLISAAPSLFTTIVNVLPGFSNYGLDYSSELSLSSENSVLSLIYPLILPVPVILFIICSRSSSKPSSHTRVRYLILFSILYIFMFAISFTEYSLSGFYSIGRVKSSIYPSLLLILSPLYSRRINSRLSFYFIWLSILVLSLVSLRKFTSIF